MIRAGRLLTSRVPVHNDHIDAVLPVFGLVRLRAPLDLNGVAAATHAFLTPNGDGRWHLRAGDAALDGVFPPDHLPTADVRAGLRALAEPLQGHPDLRTWLATPPLPPDLRAELVSLPIEDAIELHLVHLEEVVRAPHTHLSVEIERVHVSRARRTPPQALRHLAAHTEDWERRTLHAPRPRYILSELRIEQLDTYENRVVARLLDRLRDHLRGRIRAIVEILAALESMAGFSTTERANYWLARRVCALWGEKYSRDERPRDADVQLLERLRLLLRRALRMQQSPLYRAVPRLARVEHGLRPSNVFAHDPHYRHVRLLWDQCVAADLLREPSSAELHARDQLLCRDMISFAALLLVRALEQLGYAVDGTATFGPGRSAVFTLGSDVVHLRWTPDDRLLVEQASTAEIVALPASLDHVDAVRHLRPASPLLLLHLASHAVPSALHTLANDPHQRLHKDLSILPVSPLVLTSVERVARWLRWILTGTAFRAYPPVLPALREPLPGHPEWLHSDGKQARLLRPPSPNDPSLLADLLASRQTHLTNLKRQQQNLRDARKGRLDDPRDRSRMNEAMTKLSREINTCEPAIANLAAFVDGLADARRALDHLRRCPVCGEMSDPEHFEARDRDTFTASCADCETRWGTHRCLAGHVIPFIEPAIDRDADLPTAAWIEQVVGRDILALHSIDWLCPECPPA